MKGARKKNSGSEVEKQLRARSRASAAALILSALLLAAIFFFSKRSLSELENKLYPLIDEAMGAAHSGDFETVGRAGKEIDAILHENENALMIYASHRDIIDLLRCSGELASLGANGERDDYIEALATLRVTLHLLRENNTATLGNIL
ncbi:MAG: DUF4363 family protein [Clostridia bacterium]|nr:DUF4363 family protein [Clostridia bacterium]